MRVVGERVLLRHVLLPAVSKGGIHIPQGARGNSSECIVIGVGGKVENSEIKEGDRVLIQKRQGQVVAVGGRMLRTVHYDDIVAVIRAGKVELCPTCKGEGTVGKKVVALFPSEECD